MGPGELLIDYKVNIYHSIVAKIHFVRLELDNLSSESFNAVSSIFRV